MINITDPITQWAFAVLVSVVAGTFLLIVVAIFRRWSQVRFSRYVHDLRNRYRPFVARALSGLRIPTEINELRELPPADLEHLLDPVFSKRKVPERCLGALESLCKELGLIKLWECRAAHGLTGSTSSHERAWEGHSTDPPMLRHLLRAKSIRNLGMLRHRRSWRLLISTLDDRHVDLQLVALRALAAIGAPESFPVLGERLQAVVQGTASSPPLQGLQSAMANFDLASAAGLMSSLLHPNRSVRYYAAEILRTMVYRRAAQDPEFMLTPQLISPSLVELLLTALPVDRNSDVRARAAEVIIFLRDPRTVSLLGRLLEDSQWFVRMRAVRAVARMGHGAAPLHARIRRCILDPHWRVREAAIHTLLSFGMEGVRQVFEQFMRSPDGALREQILDILERAGLATALADVYETEGGDAALEPLKENAAALEPPAVRTRPGAAIHAEFLQRVIPDRNPGCSDSPAPRRKPKGASRRQIENDEPRYPSV
jgi:HEAT repeat protein